MPQNTIQRAIFALITVIITVHAYVFYSLYVINGSLFLSLTGEANVLAAIGALGGVPAFGGSLPIWAIVLVEFAFAYTLEMFLGSPLSFKLTTRLFDPRTTHPVLFETSIICSTVAIMCPSMSLIAAVIYYPYGAPHGFRFFTLLANWLKLVCYNFPFAFFTQLFFIQPFVRTVFKLLFGRSNKKRLEGSSQKNEMDPTASAD